MVEPLLKVHNVTKVFGKHVVLNGIDFNIMPGEILGIIGASGSGKTTLLNSIIGFLQPEKGDVLFNNTNSKELVGKAALVKDNLECVFSNHITRLRVDRKISVPKWLVINLNYLWRTGYFLQYSRKWIGQAGINIQMLKSIKIPLPPLSEQKKIVAYLDNLREKVEKLKKLQKEQLKDLEELKKSILEKAFKGELL